MIGKLLSGRYLLTLISGVSFLYLVISMSIKPSDAMMIITMVFTLYFSRNDRNKGGNDG